MHVEMVTTTDEDRRALELIEDALDEAYRQGKADEGAQLTPEPEWPDAKELWTQLMKAVGVEV